MSAMARNEEIETVSEVPAQFPVGSRVTSKWEPSLVGAVVGYGSQGVFVESEDDGKTYVLRVGETVEAS